MLISTRTQVWPICHVGSYDGDVLDPDYVLGVEDEQWNYDNDPNPGEEGTRIVSWEFDTDAWDKAVVEAAQWAFDNNEPLKDRGVKRVVVKKYWHPREYNFVTDDLYVDVEVDDVNEFVRNAKDVVLAEENRAKVEKYVLANWHSRDGFFSHMSETYDELADDFDTFLSEDDEDTHFHCWDVELFLGEVLTLLSLIDGELDPIDPDCGGIEETGITEDIRERLSGNHCASEFYLVYNVYEEAKKHGLKLPDFEAEKKRIQRDVDEYCNSFGEDSEQAKKMIEWHKNAVKRIDALENDLLDTFDCAMDAAKITDKDGKAVGYDYSKPEMDEDRVKEKLDEIEQELTTQLKV